jgi:hypothetical protein
MFMEPRDAKSRNKNRLKLFKYVLVKLKSVIPATISNYPGTLGLLEKVEFWKF